MSTLKSLEENLTFNADGVGKEVKFQVNGVEKASISSAGAFTSTSIDATKLSGALPAIDGSALTGIGYPLTSGTVTNTTSSTSKDYTSLPSWVKRITISLEGVSSNGSDAFLIQLGDAGGVEATSYINSSIRLGASIADYAATTGFRLYSDSAGFAYYGQITLTLIDSSTNTWSCSAVTGRTGSVYLFISTGSKSLSAVLDRVRLTTTGGTNTFDAGKINILYE